ncbi:hypothetical protein [Pseudomonas sp. M47T1]|uniref:hypothetical protein n=1 Tax=Pseudomonas sp. M47T1 TaxID=1179778 RepID=UPI001EE64AE3|nr:hypothetical protein [Pseudomonas sp. M47T1]
MNAIKIVCTSVFLLSLAACTTNPVPLAAGQSKVTLKAQPGDEMIARRLDEVPSENFGHFVISAGEHTMEIGIVKKGYQESHRTCLAKLSYKYFQANKSYDLVERSSRGGGVTLTLIENNVGTIKETDNVACL